MSVYQRIYIKTDSPREVEQLIINTLGGAGRLTKSENGEYLRPIAVAPRDQHSVLPSRCFYGTPIDAEADTGWYWLESIFDCWSIDACWVIWALFKSPLVAIVAEDNEVSADDSNSPAWIITAGHELVLEGPPMGPLE
ncbi:MULTISPECIES: hypothetical protein [Pseudomonas]|uniref:hypothetical protein n=1 Tax=Pseudomonas TaxID=286 RepID=UPI00235F1554|nr:MULTISPECIES: hypothetical protein [Pseudomonas]WJV24473.1 hypothetical protein PSR66_00005 [Pseudomonas chlororaphis]